MPFTECEAALPNRASRYKPMAHTQPAFSKTFTAFFESEKASAIVLIVCTVASLAVAVPVWERHTPSSGMRRSPG
jgi:hypothetical protein